MGVKTVVLLLWQLLVLLHDDSADFRTCYSWIGHMPIH